MLLLAAGLLFGLGAGALVFFGLPPSQGSPVEGGLGSEAVQGSISLPAPLEGAMAPDFSLEGLDGNIVQLSEYRGRVVLVNFWATWCGPCEAEMPLFEGYFEELQDEGLAVIAVNFDEAEETVRGFRDRLGLDFDVVLDPGGEVQQLYRVRGYPTSLFVDREGVVQVVHIGILPETRLQEVLADLGLQGS
jgi:peroxiredoxin